MKCKDVMTKNIITCFKNTTIREVAKIMRDKYIGMIPLYAHLVNMLLHIVR